MGVYLNPTGEKFKRAINSEIYIDKTELIEVTNSLINTEQQYMCISRPRRFGKSMAANMLAAYYSRGEDADGLFIGLAISKSESYRKHLNHYNVICVNMQEFLSNSSSIEDMLETFKKRLLYDLKTEYPDCVLFDSSNLTFSMQDIFASQKMPFVILIDEWDCIFREYKTDIKAQKKYLSFLRDWLKDKDYISLAYMTGILPVKKYGTHSALNMFSEYSMTNPKKLASYFGFTEGEVKYLCERYNMDFSEIRTWYDGYHFNGCLSIYNPRSVVEAMLSQSCDTYWNQTETFEALKIYIDMNFDGLKEAVISMLAGEHVNIDIRSFTNDMTTFHSYEDVLTLLVHLGYLAYSRKKEEVYIPNKEISKEYVTTIKATSWGAIIRSVKNSKSLLDAVWNCENDKVAQGVEKAHEENSFLQYNDENALSYTISLAFYSAREYYQIVREMPAGKGFADMVFVPRRNNDKPALIIELKWNKSAKTAISQIKNKKYIKALDGYCGEILLVGINYEPKSKKHECIIEKYEISNV